MLAPHSPNRLGRLTRRREFLAAAAGRRKWVAPGFVLQVRDRDPIESNRVASMSVRFGLTATKKLGNAVVRNRARRRLREAARLVLPDVAPIGVDFVLIARTGTLTHPFSALLSDLRLAVRRLTAGRRRQSAVPADFQAGGIGP